MIEWVSMRPGPEREAAKNNYYETRRNKKEKYRELTQQCGVAEVTDGFCNRVGAFWPCRNPDDRQVIRRLAEMQLYPSPIIIVNVDGDTFSFCGRNTKTVYYRDLQKSEPNAVLQTLYRSATRIERELIRRSCDLQ